jgi:MYXO-CTERM domain-containing protein
MRTSLLLCLCVCFTFVGVPVSRALDGEPATARMASQRVASPLSVLSVETEIVRPVSSGMSFAGAAIAVDGDLLLIGVPGRTNGDPGEVYTYRHDGTEWTLLPASTLMRHGTTAANFGAAISMSGTVAVVGAPNDDAGNGSAWRFTFDGTSWDAGTEIVAPPMTPNRFGTSVAITAEGRIAIGAPDSGTRMTVAGAVAVYEAGSSTGTLVVAPGPTASSFDDLFGVSVAFDGESLLVGAPQNDESGTDAGAAFAFERGDGFVASVRLRPSPMFRTLFGTSVALSSGGTIAAVGAPEHGPVLADNRGGVYLFERSAASMPWPTTAEPLLAEDPTASSYFGTSVALEGERLVVGAPLRDGPVSDGGGAYLFERRTGTWTALARFQISTDSLTSARAALGTEVAISGERVLVSAPAFMSSTGFVASFAVPAANGAVCGLASNCESEFCVEGICCNTACTGDCLSCATGMCIAGDEGAMCTSACGMMGTCGGGVCSGSETCDAGVPDAGFDAAFDAGGPRMPVRISGCKCGVGHAPMPAGVALVVLALGFLIARRRP